MAGNPTPRIMREAKLLNEDKVPGINAVQDQDNFRVFKVSIEGPKDTPYQGGNFEADLLQPTDYPMSPPKILMITKIWHPNIDRQGRICLDILKNKWTPALQIRSVQLSLQALLSAPDASDFLNIEAAEMWQKNPDKANKQAAEWTKLHATKK